MPKLLLTVREAAAVLSISRSKLYQLLATGEIPSVHIASARRIRAEDLDAYVARLDAAAR
jgi:excisionase family DNA binding protein